MKFLTPLAALLSTASAAAISPRQAPESVTVKVTNLQCQPRGTTCFLTFEVRSSASSPPLICTATTQATTTIPSVPNESCSDPNAVFSFTAEGPSRPAFLSFTWTSDWARGVQKVHAARAFSTGDFSRDQTGTQSYVGPSEFVISGVTTSLIIRQ
ncbi:hypothetical protein MCOR25_010268 [Pyricularia grisea]|uniref:Hypersensitive response-inducing protein n=1 Tax=Pyricularia grisea TaxID=148305 RepID=A0A6P8B2T2_PYRGI|nr:uncharacterized protein PgNI_07833 [Pyricularia grisea]KAI6350949.1 hypothetical protein MCOR25_010268 [Pyricularia grisea]TLD09176.1 hypothetical protein PgNI_07833 [Pyricularia grisea]